MKFEYLGKVVDSQYHDGNYDLEKHQFIRDNFFSVTFEEADKQLKSILLDGKVTQNKIYGYYFERVAADTVLFDAKFSVNQMLASDDLLNIFINYTTTKSKVFTLDLIGNIKTANRIACIGGVKKATNYPLKECIASLAKHKLGSTGRYVDTSCGWGVRMLAAAVLDLEYVGFDVNPQLIEKLNEFGKHIQQYKPNWKFAILPIGSENFVPKLENTASIMLTSPPYFMLEDYTNGGKQSTKLFGDYSSWCEGFLKPTLENSFKYAKPGSKVLFNIKDYKGFDLVAKSKEYAQAAGFVFVGTDSLKNGSRVKSTKELVNANEDILVFLKPEA